MSRFELDVLREILRTRVGEVDGVDLDGDIADLEFAELGYDSLAVLELCSHVGRLYGLQIPGDAVAEMPTPGKAVEYINALLTEAGL